MSLVRWFITILIAFLVTTNLYASCELPTELEGLKCKGTYRARDLGDVQNYLESLGVETSSQNKNGKKNKKKDKHKDHAKNLLIDFDLNSSSLSLATPCEVELKNKREINLSGDLCIKAKKFKTHRPEIKAGSIEIKTKESIRIPHKSRLTAISDLSLTSIKGGVTIGHSSVVRGENILLESLANNQHGRTHIRHDSLVEGKTLTLKSFSRATLGKSSVFNLSEFIKLESADALFSALWKNSIINTPRLEIISSKKIIVAAKTKINAETLVLEAPECKIHKSAVFNVTNKLGTCFGTTEEPPHAVLAASPLEGSTPLVVNFDMSASTGSFGQVNIDYGDGQTETLNKLTFSHTYTTVGDFVATAEYVTPGGLKSSAYVQVRVLPVNNPPEIFLYASQIETGGIITTILSLEEYPSGIGPNDIKYFHWDLGPIGKIRLPMGAQGSDEYGAIPVNYPEAGSYPVELKLELQDGSFLSTGEQQVNVWDNTFPVPLYSVSTDNGPAPLTVTFDASSAYSSDGSEIVQYRWRLPTGEVRGGEELKTITHTFTDEGVYLVRLRILNAHNNRSQVIIPIYVGVTPPEEGNAPIAVLRADQRMGTAPHFVQFTGDQSFDVEMGPLTFQWDMNDFKEDSYPTITNPTHTFDKSGVYYVTMRIFDEDSNENVAGTFIYVNDEGMNSPLDFVATHHGGGDVQLQSYFLANTQAYDPQSFIWHLDLGGEKVTQVSGSELFATLPGPGSYSASLTGRLVNGPYNTVQKTLTIDENTVMPEGFITQTKDLFDLYEPVILNAEITNLDPANLTFKWFTENYYLEATGTDGMQFVHQFETEGSKTVNLLVEDQNGFSVLMTQYPSVEIIQAQNNPPFASLQVHNYIEGSPAPATVSFDAGASYDGDGFITNIRFDFGTGESVSGTEAWVEHTYQSSGHYTAIVTVEDNLGATSTAQVELNFSENQAPIVFFETIAEDFVAPATIQFNAYPFTYDQDGEVVNLKWVFGDGSFVEGTDASVTHTYQEAGTFLAQLVATDNLGLSSEASFEVTVLDNAPPVITLFAEVERKADLPRNITIDAGNSSDPEHHQLSFEIFVDGNLISQESSATYLATEARDYQILVKVTDEKGASTSAAKFLTVKPSNSAPVANFTLEKSEFLVGETVVTDASSSSDVDGGLLKYEWTWNQSTVKTGVVSSYFFEKVGQFDIFLKVTDEFGATDEMTKTITVSENDEFLPTPVIDYAGAHKENMENPVYLHGTFSSSKIDANIVSYVWDMGDGTIKEGSVVQHKYQSLGTYIIKLTITDEFNLQNTAVESITVTRNAVNSEEEDNFARYSETIFTPRNIASGVINPIPGEIQIDVTNGFLDAATATSIQIYINGGLVPINEVSFNESLIQFSTTLLTDGLNTISIIGQDELGKELDYEGKFVFGSNSIDVSVVDENNNPVSNSLVTIMYQKDEEKALAQVETNESGVAQLNNIAFTDSLIIASQGTKISTPQILSNLQASYELQLNEFQAEVYSYNNNYSESFRGWDHSVSGIFSIVNRDGEKRILITTAGGEGYWYRKITNISTLGASNLSHELNVRATGSSYKVIGLYRSLVSDEVHFEIQNVNSFDGLDQYLSINPELQGNGDYELFVSLIPTQEVSTSFLDYFIGKSYAADGSTETEGSEQKVSIGSFSYFDYNRTSQNTVDNVTTSYCKIQSLKSFMSVDKDEDNSLAPFLYVQPEKVKNCDSSNPTVIYPIGVVVKYKGKHIATYTPAQSSFACNAKLSDVNVSKACSTDPSTASLKFNLTNLKQSVVDELKSIPLTAVVGKEVTTHFIWTNDSDLSQVEPDTRNCDGQAVFCSEDTEKRTPLVLYSSSLPRYGDKDLSVGGDRWILPNYYNLFNSISTTLSTQGVVFGDATSAHGDTFLPHASTHANGKHIDIRTRHHDPDSRNLKITRDMYKNFMAPLSKLLRKTKNLSQVVTTEYRANLDLISHDDFVNTANYDKFKGRACLGETSAMVNGNDNNKYSFIRRDQSSIHRNHFHLQFDQPKLAWSTTSISENDFTVSSVNIVEENNIPSEGGAVVRFLDITFARPAQNTYLDFIYDIGFDYKYLFQDIPNGIVYKSPGLEKVDMNENELNFIQVTKNGDGSIKVKIRENDQGNFNYDELRQQIFLEVVKLNQPSCKKRRFTLPNIGCLKELTDFDPDKHLGHYHQNGGGFISNNSTADPTALINTGTSVCDGARVMNNVALFGRNLITGNATIGANTVVYGPDNLDGTLEISAGEDQTIRIGGAGTVSQPTLISASQGSKINGSVDIDGSIEMGGIFVIDSEQTQQGPLQGSIKINQTGIHNLIIYSDFNDGNPLRILGNTEITGHLHFWGTQPPLENPNDIPTLHYMIQDSTIRAATEPKWGVRSHVFYTANIINSQIGGATPNNYFYMDNVSIYNSQVSGADVYAFDASPDDEIPPSNQVAYYHESDIEDSTVDGHMTVGPFKILNSTLNLKSNGNTGDGTYCRSTVDANIFNSNLSGFIIDFGVPLNGQTKSDQYIFYDNDPVEGPIIQSFPITGCE